MTSANFEKFPVFEVATTYLCYNNRDRITKPVNAPPQQHYENFINCHPIFPPLYLNKTPSSTLYSHNEYFFHHKAICWILCWNLFSVVQIYIVINGSKVWNWLNSVINNVIVNPYPHGFRSPVSMWHMIYVIDSI